MGCEGGLIVKVRVGAVACALALLTACGPTKVELPIDPDIDTDLSGIVAHSTNTPLIATYITGCVAGKDATSNQPVRVCDVCYVNAAVELIDGTTDFVLQTRRATVQFRLAASASQPKIVPDRPKDGVWAIDPETFRTTQTYTRTQSANLTRWLNFERRSGYSAVGSMTPSGHYYMPEDVREKIANDPTIKSSVKDAAHSTCYMTTESSPKSSGS